MSADPHALIGLEFHFRGVRPAAEEAHREALRLQPAHPLAGKHLKELLGGCPPGGLPDRPGH